LAIDIWGTMSAAQNQVATSVPNADAESFVINLCSSTTPMALTYPATPELKRFSFFVSRRREDGRERFRLHMGYFASAAEAEEWLALVRDVYPGAWASEAPGRALRAAKARARGPAPSLAAVAPAPAAASAPATSIATASPTAAVPSPADFGGGPGLAAEPASLPFVPTLHAAPIVREPPVVHPAEAPKTAFEESNLREVLAELGSTPEPPLSDTQALALLEKRGTSRQAPVDPSIRMLEPDDTDTRRALTEAVRNDAPVSFAVQLLWSVQPLELSKVPPLAIFNAYTLYTIDGNREGRKWYGLRLGFFSDANSAKQAGQYVRSEFASVAVVPLPTKELNTASSPAKMAQAPGIGAQPETSRAAASGEFKLVEDAPRELPAANAAAPPPAALPASAKGSARPASAGSRHKSAHGRVAKSHRAPQTLEETLEILGANCMEIDNGRGELLNDTAVRHLQVVPQKNTAFGRLLERITERVRRG